MKKLFASFLAIFGGSKDFVFDLVFKALRSEVKKIKSKALQTFVEQKLAPIQEIADLLTDDNKNNKQQLTDWWNSNKERLVDDHILIAAETIANMPKVSTHTKTILVNQLVTLAAQNVFRKAGDESNAFVSRHVTRISSAANIPMLSVSAHTVTPVEPKPVVRKPVKQVVANAKEAAVKGVPKKRGRAKKTVS